MKTFLMKHDYTGEKLIWKVLDPQCEWFQKPCFNLDWIIEWELGRQFRCSVEGDKLKVLSPTLLEVLKLELVDGDWRGKLIPHPQEFFRDFVSMMRSEPRMLPLKRNLLLSKSAEKCWWEVLQETRGVIWIDPNVDCYPEAVWMASKHGWKVFGALFGRDGWHSFLRWSFKTPSCHRLVLGDPVKQMGNLVSCWLPDWNVDLLYASEVCEFRQHRKEELRALVPLSKESRLVDFRETQWKSEVVIPPKTGGKTDLRWKWLSMCAQKNLLRWLDRMESGYQVWFVGGMAKHYLEWCLRGSRLRDTVADESPDS